VNDFQERAAPHAEPSSGGSGKKEPPPGATPQDSPPGGAVSSLTLASYQRNLDFAESSRDLVHYSKH
jgi:hypothetical protein